MTQNDHPMTFDDAAAMGLSRDEWELILKRLDRTPNQCDFVTNLKRHAPAFSIKKPR